MEKLLTTTALVFAMVGGVHAQTAAPGFAHVEMQQGDFYASTLIGMRIYNSSTQLEADATIVDGGEADWDNVGEINDILITPNGEVSAVILGVGGFLGIGERDIAVPMSAVTIVHEADNPNDRFLVVSTTREALEQLPAFEREQVVDAGVPATGVAPAAVVAPAAGVAPVNAVANDAVADRPLLPRPAVKRDGYTDVDMEAVQQMTSDDLVGAAVYGASDDKIGDIASLVVGEDGKINAVVVDVGGFLGIGKKSVAVTFDELQILKQSDGSDVRIYLDSTKDALQAQPEYKG